MNVISTRTSTTAVSSCSVATSSSESLRGDGKAQSVKEAFVSEMQLWPYGFYEACVQISTQRKWYS